MHPAAAMLPMMGDDELQALADDIKANGLQEPIILWRDNREAANGSEGPFPLWLLDGRNRLAALKLLGIDDPSRAPDGQIVESKVRILTALQEGALIGGRASRTTWRPNVDPATFVVSMNMHRRHLTTEQKRQAIADHIKLDPTASDRKISRKVGVDNKTVVEILDTVRANAMPTGGAA